MSFTDPADVEQPVEGQDDAGTSDAPYAEYLNRVPEELRGDIEPVFKDWDANVTRRFQDSAEFRKQWEPLADTGINQFSPEEVAWAAQLLPALNEPQVMQQWWEGYAKQNGLTQAEVAAVQEQVETTDEFGYQDPNQQLQKMLDEKLSPLAQQVEQFSQWRDQQAQQSAQAEALQFIERQVSELEGKHGAFNDKTKALLNTLAGAYVDSDPMNAIPRAYDDLTRWQNEIETDALQNKVDAPAPAEAGGVPDLSPETHSRIDAAGVKDAAIEFLRNSNRV